MRSELSLLDRIDDATHSQRYTVQFDYEKQLRNVVLHIQRMLNVRLGSVVALEDFGMPDFNDIVNHFPDAIFKIQTAIRVFIQKYEPRMADVTVAYIPDTENPLIMKFAISGTLKHREGSQRVMFDTVLTGSGQASVKV